MLEALRAQSSEELKMLWMNYQAIVIGEDCLNEALLSDFNILPSEWEIWSKAIEAQFHSLDSDLLTSAMTEVLNPSATAMHKLPLFLQMVLSCQLFPLLENALRDKGIDVNELQQDFKKSILTQLK